MQVMKRIAFLLFAVLTACAGADDAAVIETDRFIDVVVELRRAAIELRHDPAAYEARRDQVLGSAGVTEAQLRTYVERRGTDLDHMAGVWSTINSRMSELEATVQ
jgi:hypothetical protein